MIHAILDPPLKPAKAAWRDSKLFIFFRLIVAVVS